MAHIERKVYYVGIWREDKVTDSTMGHIIARSQAEKGQKVKVKLSQGGLILSKTVLFQENLISSMALQDVYFLTVNQRHPCCLLCIGADPVRNYLIQVLRTVNPVEAQELISTFKALKDNPTIDSGNVVLRRKDNGKWTLRERSQHNANRHLQEVFKEDPGLAPPTTLSQPNGSAGGGHAPVIDGDKATNGDGRSRYRLVPDDALGGNGGLVMVPAQREVDELSQELQDVKLVVEKTGSVSPAVLRRSLSRNSSKNKVITVVNSNDDNNNNNNNDDDDDDDKSPYIETEVLPVTTKEHNGGVIHVYSTGGTEEAQEPEEKAGEVGWWWKTTAKTASSALTPTAVLAPTPRLPPFTSRETEATSDPWRSRSPEFPARPPRTPPRMATRTSRPTRSTGTCPRSWCRCPTSRAAWCLSRALSAARPPPRAARACPSTPWCLRGEAATTLVSSGR
ncbi:uncharacterized protein LOC143275009 [Babylonia areolata]|uniref:uncharacterized protein LOC143275009 n=1 Tax=Babylonia areolata TaxID=304850 RepID=UPI003FD137DD